MSVGWGSPGDKPPIGELKRGDGLQNLLASLDFAKHEYWSQHGVNHNVFKADLNTARYSPPDSVANTSLTLAPPSLRSVSGHQEISPYICSSIVSVSQRPASCSEEAKMVEFSKMDNSALVAAALAGSSKSTNTGSKAKTNNDSDMISSSQHPVQTNQGENRSSKRRRENSSSPSSQTQANPETKSALKHSQRKKRTVSFHNAPDSSPSDHSRVAKSTPKNYRDNDSSDEGDGDDEEYQDLPQPVTTKSPRRNPEKSLSHHSISQKELSGLNLGITNSGSSDRPRQRKLKTTNYGSFDQDPDDENDEDYADTATNQPAKPRRSAVVVETPSKKGPIRLVLNSDPFTPSPPSSCAASESESEEDDNFEDEDFHSDSPPRPSPGKRRQLRRDAKENAKNTLSSNTRSSKSTTTNTKAKRGAKGKAKSNSKASAPSSANRSSAARNRTYTFPVASTLSQASEADRMMFRWRGQGKSWSEINAEWSRLTGVEPGKSSLSVRFGKLKEKFARMGDKDFSRLLNFKSEVEQKFEMVEKWERIAEMIRKDGGGDYTGPALRRKYRDLVEQGGQQLQGNTQVPGLPQGEEVEEEELDDFDREFIGEEEEEEDGDDDADAEVNVCTISDEEVKEEDDHDQGAEEAPSKKTKGSVDVAVVHGEGERHAGADQVLQKEKEKHGEMDVDDDNNIHTADGDHVDDHQHGQNQGAATAVAGELVGEDEKIE